MSFCNETHVKSIFVQNNANLETNRPIHAETVRFCKLTRTLICTRKMIQTEVHEIPYYAAYRASNYKEIYKLYTLNVLLIMSSL